MGSAARGSGGALLRGLCRAITRRGSVHASSSFDGAFLGERIHQAKQDMSRLLSMSLMKRMSPFFAGRIRENHRLLSSSFASALHEVSSSPSPSVDDVHMTDACIQNFRLLKVCLKKRKMLRLSVETGGCSGFELLRKSIIHTLEAFDYSSNRVETFLDELVCVMSSGTVERCRQVLTILVRHHPTASIGIKCLSKNFS
ncbi:hypothetical protein ACJRO7_014711 [Eucalyptus globulus]|uniref:Uncharacterized protein n=1 Tax=Eucalyptus globulus TaxID=34317 RepID=A0ABD3LBM3_EUCGL